MKKPAAVVTSDQPFFDPGASPSIMLVTQSAEVFTQSGEAPGMTRESAATITATRPVESPGTGSFAAQSVEAPGARTATQPFGAPSARTDVHSQPTSTFSGDGSAVDRSLTSNRTVADNTGVSDMEDELCSERESPDVVSDRDPAKDDKLDQERSEEKLLWRILACCAKRQVTLKARHISGQLNVIADKLSRLS